MKKAIFTKQELYELTREAFYSKDMERQTALPTSWREFAGETAFDPKFSQLEDKEAFVTQINEAARGVELQFHELEELLGKKEGSPEEAAKKKQEKEAEISESLLVWLGEYCEQ